MSIEVLQEFINTCGFPITVAFALGFGAWKMYKKMSDELDKVTETNTELVKTNANLVASLNTKMDSMENKLDKVLEKIN